MMRRKRDRKQMRKMLTVNINEGYVDIYCTILLNFLKV